MFPHRSSLVYTVDRFDSVVQMGPGDIFNVFCVFGKNMQRLSEKTRFPGFLFPQIVHDH